MFPLNLARKHLVVMLLIFAAAPSGCDPAPTAASAGAPTTTRPAAKPTTIPPSSKPTDARSTPIPGVQCPCFEGLSSSLNNATQARIRAVSGLPLTNVDVYINDRVVSNGGHLQANIADSVFSGWVYVQPGSYTLTLVPHGGPESQALFAPVTVNAQAGHRYTVAAMGQVSDQTVHGQVFDETALEAALGRQPTNDMFIMINNVKGMDGLDTLHDGKLADRAPYAQASAFACADNNLELEQITPAGAPGTVLAQGKVFCRFDISSAAMWYGSYPDNVIGGDDSQYTHDTTDTLKFLADFNNHQMSSDDGHLLTFKTLLALIDKAGMTDLFSRQQPYFFLAPTDEAFAALPKDQLNALANNPDQLATFVKSYYIPGYYPFGSLSGGAFGQTDTTVTNLLGSPITLYADFVNGKSILAGPSIAVGNGNRIQFIDGLLAAD